jgi:hypothetical protein
LVLQAAAYRLGTRIRELSIGDRAAQECPHLMPVDQKLMQEMTADETAGTC